MINIRKMILHVILIFVSSNLAACNYYSDPIRQHNLCKSLSNHVEFQQVPATLNSPPQYKLCGDNCYPCESYTPLYFQHPNLHAKKIYKKHRPLVLRKSHKNHTHNKNSKSDLSNNPQSSLLLLRKVYERN